MSRFVPYHLQHRAKGQARYGGGRQSKGLLLRGVVLAVHLPGDPAARGLPLGGVAPGVTCDVLILEPTYRTILYSVPLAVESAGIEDHLVWIPTPATKALSGGQLIVSPEGSGQRPTPLSDMDGDWVLIGFMADDLAKPVIIGQVPHPGNQAKPLFPVAPYKWRRTLAGVDAQVGAGEATITLETGDINTANRISIVDSALSAPEVVLRGETFLADTKLLLTNLSASLTEISTVLAVFGLALPITTGTTIPQITAMLATIDTSIATGNPYLSTHLEVD